MSPSARTDAVADLVGRDAESELLDELIDGLPNAGGALIVRGEAGIGKSALPQRARERVRGRGGRVRSTVGVESEADLAFAGLHQLLHPIIGLIERVSEAHGGADVHRSQAGERASGSGGRARQSTLLRRDRPLCAVASKTPVSVGVLEPAVDAALIEVVEGEVAFATY